MNPRLPARSSCAALVALVALFEAHPAHAQATPTCVAAAAAAAPGAKIIYGEGGSSPNTLLGKFATHLAYQTQPPPAGAPTPLFLVYASPGACQGYNDLTGATNITGTATYWDSTGKAQTCTLDGITGNAVQFAVTNNYATLCPGVTALADGYGDFLGPIQSFDFIVPNSPTAETSISAAAAYFTYGLGTGASPWTDNGAVAIAKRDQNSAAALLVALSIGVPVTKLKGTDAKNNNGVITAVAGGGKDAIGFVADEIAQANSATVSVLAYQHYGQTCGYWPSSTAKALDKRSIRDGHYFIWGNIHYLAKIDPTSKLPSDPDVAKLITYLEGTATAPAPFNLLGDEISAGTVPDCAMEVKRTSDLGDVTSYAPNAPCGCYFDKTATGTTECQACTTDATCPAGATHCRNGYCEVN